MKKNNNQKFKQGAASFYIVAFSTLILLVVAMSFAAIIISEVERTSNDDLSQSAYDSAMAGIEDGKLAYQKYMQCKNNNNKDDNECKRITALINKVNTYQTTIENNESEYCDTVASILGRASDGTETGTPIDEYQGNIDNVENNMQQKYTCTNLRTRMKDYEGSISSSMPARVIKLKFDDGVVNKVDRVTFSWKTEDSDVGFNTNNFQYGKVVFPSLTTSNVASLPNSVASPATMSVGLVQTNKEFKMEDFEKVGKGTNRGLIYLVPGENAGSNTIGKEAFVKSNDKKATNEPNVVNCNRNNEYPCSVTIGIPGPVNGGDRNSDTFMMVVSAPYGQPKTNFKLEYGCSSGDCESKVEEGTDDGTKTEKDVAMLDGVQIEIDSTGRARDLYRRVRARLESDSSASGSYLSILGPLELTDSSSEAGTSNDFNLKKTLTVTCEANLGASNCQ